MPLFFTGFTDIEAMNCNSSTLNPHADSHTIIRQQGILSGMLLVIDGIPETILHILNLYITSIRIVVPGYYILIGTAPINMKRTRRLIIGNIR